MLNVKNYVSLSGKFFSFPEINISKNGKEFFENKFKFFNPDQGHGYIKVLAFGKMLKQIKLFTENDLVEIEGGLEQQNYFNKEKIKIYYFQIVIKKINLLEKNKYQYYKEQK